MTAIGDPITRVDGIAKVTGAAKYAAEFDIPKVATAVIVTSTIPNGRIVRMEVASAQRVPGVLVRLGIYNEVVGSIHSGHSPQFRLDEDAIPTGIATLVAFARGIGDGSIAIPAHPSTGSG